MAVDPIGRPPFLFGIVIVFPNIVGFDNSLHVLVIVLFNIVGFVDSIQRFF